MKNIQVIQNNRGMSMIEILVAGVIMGIIVYGIVTGINAANNSSKKIAERTDVELIRQLIMGYVDCDATFETGSASKLLPNSATDCGSTSGDWNLQKGPYLRLRRKALVSTPNQFLTDPLSGDSARLGKWLIKTSCSSADQSLIVRAIPADDPKAQWADSKLIFGKGGSALPLCYATMGFPWTSPNCNGLDVNNNGYVSAADALQIINKLNSGTGADIKLDPPTTPGTPPPYYDVNKNNFVDRQDALTIINCLNTGVTPCNGLACGASALTLSWHKSSCPWDTNDDNSISATDALQVINMLNTVGVGEHQLTFDISADRVAGSPPTHPAGPPYVDVNGNNRVDPNDALAVVDRLNTVGPGLCP